MSGNHATGASRKQLLALLISGLLAAGALAVSLGPVMNAFAAPSKPAAKVKIAQVAPEAAGINQGLKVQGKNIKMRPLSGGGAKPPSKADLYGGCTPGYGRGAGTKGCLPPISPAAAAMRMSAEQMPWTCTQVHVQLPKGIALTVKGVDPLGLDHNKDGVACGSGD